MKKRILLVTLALIMLVSLIPFTMIEVEAASEYEWLLPVNNGGKIAYLYGYSNAYFNGTVFHRGIDLHNKTNDDTVYAAFSGTVYAINNNCQHLHNVNCTDAHRNTWGNSIYVKSEDGKLYGIYGHLSQNSMLVKKGDKITKGQALAKIGSSGNSTGYHLHFEVRRSLGDRESTINVNPTSQGGVVNYIHYGYNNQLNISPATIEEGQYYFNNNGYRLFMKKDKKEVVDAINTSNGSIDETFAFTVEPIGSYYKIYPTSTKNDLVLHAFWLSNYYDNEHSNAPSVNGDEVALWSRDSDLSQQWIFEECNGGYLIHPADSPKLSITRMGNNNLYVMTTTKADNQIWKLEKAGDNDYTSSEFLAERINQALALYGPGEYFTKDGKACTVCHNSSSVDCIINGSSCNCLRYVEINGKTVDLMAVQDEGYARYWQQMLFGASETDTSSFLKMNGPGDVSFTMLYVWLYNNQEALHPGTHLIVNNGKTSIVLLDFNLDYSLGVENATVTYIECNKDLMCGIEPITTLCFDDFCERFQTIDYAYIYSNYYSEYPEDNVSCAHKYEYKSDVVSHWIECTICESVLSKRNHQIDTNIKYNSDSHWVECTTCLYKEEDPHTLIFCETENQFKHRLKCKHCDYDSGEVMHNVEPVFKYNSDIHWIECKTCPYTEESPHRLKLTPTNSGHLEECDFCDYEAVKPHTLTTVKSSKQHWYECDCGYISDKSLHSVVTNNDSTHHWKECDCGYATNKVEHSLSDAFDSENKWQECADCLYKTDPTPNTSLDEEKDPEPKPTTDVTEKASEAASETDPKRKPSKDDKDDKDDKDNNSGKINNIYSSIVGFFGCNSALRGSFLPLLIICLFTIAIGIKKISKED